MSDFGRSVVCAIVAGVVALGTVGCQKHSKSETYYLISGNLAVPYWKTVNSGFEKAADELNVTAQLRGPDTNDARAEATEFQRAAALKPAGILVSVEDAGLLKPEIDAAVAAGVPVITVDSDAPRSSRLYFVGTNNLEAGRLGAQRLVDKLGGKGNVVFFTIKGQPNLDERLKGYVDVFNEHPGLKVVDSYDMKGDSGLAMDRTTQLVTQTGAQKVDAFVCLDSASGKDVAEVLKRANASDRELIAMDVNADTLQLIKDGKIDATVSQKPWTMGYVGLQALAAVHEKKPESFKSNYQVNSFSPYPVFVDTGTSLVTKDNVDLFLASAAQAQGK